jgi:hypothetical protein
LAGDAAMDHGMTGPKWAGYVAMISILVFKVRFDRQSIICLFHDLIRFELIRVAGQLLVPLLLEVVIELIIEIVVVEIVKRIGGASYVRVDRTAKKLVVGFRN